MYNKKNFNEEFINSAYERALNINRRNTSGESYKGTPSVYFRHKTWPEVIRLYKETKKAKTLLS